MDRFKNNSKKKYEYILKKLLYKLLKIDEEFGFPKITHLPYGKRFCIVKDITTGTENVNIFNIDKCSIFSGCDLIMSAEIREENIPSNEDIFEFLDILLRISIDDENILQRFSKNIVITNINRNEVQQFNLLQRMPKTLSNQRRQFAEEAQSRVLQNNEQSSNNLIFP